MNPTCKFLSYKNSNENNLLSVNQIEKTLHIGSIRPYKKNYLRIKTLFICAALILSFNLSAQVDDPEARKVLDQVSQKIASFGAFKVVYDFESEDIKADDHFSESGSIVIKGNKYRIEMENMDIFYNGTTMWVYLKNSGEVTIMAADAVDGGGLDFTNPMNFFTFYQDDFKSAYVKEEEFEGKLCHKIDLYPKKLDTEYSRIRLMVDKSRSEIYFMKVFLKEGVHYSFKIKQWQAFMDANDAFFIFDTSQYPDVEVIDMR